MLHSCFDDNYPRDLQNHIQTNLKSNQPRHMSKVIVIDPGHGGTSPVGGSSPNNATALPSGILEKTMTLDMAKRIRSAIAGKTADVEVVLTRSTDVNIGIGDRARTSANNRADLFLSIHFNAFNRAARGVETWIRSTTNGNVNFDADKAFATKVQNAMLGALRKHDPATPDRGVKNDDERDSPWGVLNDISLGNSRGGAHLSRACLVEIEFIDVATVDRLLNTGSNVEDVRNDLAAAIARALLDELDVSFDADEHLTPIKRDPAVPKTGQVTDGSDYQLPVWADGSFPNLPWKMATVVKGMNSFEGLVRNSFHKFEAEEAKPKAVYYEAKFAIDADGSGKLTPGDTSDDNTSLHDKDDVAFDASKFPFIVLPLPRTGTMVQDHGVKLGDLGVCFYKNAKSVAVLYGDLGPRDRLGEGSVIAAEKLGINGDPLRGGIDAGEIGVNLPRHSGIVHIVFPGSGAAKTHLRSSDRAGFTEHTPETVDVEARSLLAKLVG